MSTPERYSEASSAAGPLRRWRAVGLVVVFGGLLLAGSFGAAKKTAAPVASPPPAAGDKIAWAAAVAYVDVPGGIRYLYPVQPGEVKMVVQEDVPLKKGGLVLKVDDELARVQEEQARVALQSAEKRVQEAELQLEQHKRTVEMQEAAIGVARSKRSVAVEQHKKINRIVNIDKASGRPEDVAIAKKMIDEAEAGVKAEEVKLELIKSKRRSLVYMAESAKLDVQANAAQLQKAKLVVRQCEVHAPCAGKVLRSGVSVGEVLGPSPKQPILWFCPDGERIVRAEVEQEFATRVKKGQKVTIEADTLSKDPLTATGTVRSISDWAATRRSTVQEPMQFNDVRTIEVVIALDGEAKEISSRIGLRVRVKAVEE
jgi:multidrug resistance efflux pump